jgi:hypothetical protein
MVMKSGIVVTALALLCSACAGGGPPPGFDEDDPEDGPRVPQAQLFISPAGKPFRAAPGQPYPVTGWFAEADSSGDGVLTRDEFRADSQAWFLQLDVNKDGQIDMPEVSRWEEDLVPEITRTPRSGTGNPRDRTTVLGRNELNTYRQGAGPYSVINEPHPIRGADTDFSYSVSALEFRAAADRRFSLLDVDGDGKVALGDLRRTLVQGSAPPNNPRRR